MSSSSMSHVCMCTHTNDVIYIYAYYHLDTSSTCTGCTCSTLFTTGHVYTRYSSTLKHIPNKFWFLSCILYPHLYLYHLTALLIPVLNLCCSFPISCRSNDSFLSSLAATSLVPNALPNSSKLRPLDSGMKK